MTARYAPGPRVESLDRLAELLDTIGLVFVGPAGGNRKIQNRRWIANMMLDTVRGFVARGYIREALDLEDPPEWLAELPAGPGPKIHRDQLKSRPEETP